MGIYIRDKKSGIYWIQFQIKNCRIHESSGFTERTKAQEVHDRRRLAVLETIRLGRKPVYSWAEAAGEWLVQQEGKRSLEKDRIILAWLHPYLGNKQLPEIDREMIEILRRRKAKETSRATANRYMALVRAILRKAADEWNWIDKAPKVSMYRLEERRIVTASKDQMDRLIRLLPDHLAAMARFTLETGLRRHNVTHLTWGQVDLGKRLAWIHGDQAKGKQAIAVPLTDRAVSILMEQTGRHDEYVFVYQGRPVYQTSTKAWRNACRKAGLPSLRWHDLRHVWASWLAQGGTPLLALQELGGWKSAEMVRRYSHFMADHLRDYAERALGKAHQNPPQGNVARLEKKAK